mmetsp:Transcript_35088/g.69237  ORF Transcript_35088/g.69237 Transcript_35088/m.69237 type:complete len:200 (-) Transcript_35088:322-921(-)
MITPVLTHPYKLSVSCFSRALQNDPHCSARLRMSWQDAGLTGFHDPTAKSFHPRPNDYGDGSRSCIYKPSSMPAPSKTLSPPQPQLQLTRQRWQKCIPTCAVEYELCHSTERAPLCPFTCPTTNIFRLSLPLLSPSIPKLHVLTTNHISAGHQEISRRYAQQFHSFFSSQSLQSTQSPQCGRRHLVQDVCSDSDSGTPP